MSKSNLHSFCLRLAIALAPGLAVAGSSYADQILVPGEQPTIQAGIDAAVNGDEVILADGTYTGVGNFNCTFGGKLITVRSASGNPETCVINCENVFGRRGFLFNSGETSAAVLSGVTIRDGNIGTPGGGAILMVGATPTITRCRFISNTSHFSGGAIIGGGALIDQCDFIGNDVATQGGAIVGGNWTIRGCRFVSNFAGSPPENQQGGAVRLTGTSNLIVNCLFNNNFSDEAGGAIYSDAVDTRIINCLFNINFSDGAGGAIFTDAVGTQIINCTFAMNIANLNAAASGGGAIFTAGGTTTVANCIAVDNVPEQFRVDAGTLDVTFSNIEGGWPGVGNIASDPQFVDPSAEDYHLADTSPCIDAASNPAVPRGITEDLDGHPRFVDDPATIDTGLGRAPIVDMGAYEFQPPFDPADLDEDGDVDGFDLALLLGAWGACPKRGDCAADLDGDGDVDGFDLAILLAAWS